MCLVIVQAYIGPVVVNVIMIKFHEMLKALVYFLLFIVGLILISELLILFGFVNYMISIPLQ